MIQDDYGNEVEHRMPNKVKYIEPKISLQWLIGTAAGLAVTLIYLGMNIQIQTGQVKVLTDKVQELQVRLDTRDNRIEGLSRDFWEMRSIDNLQTQRIDALTRQLEQLNAKVGK